MNNSENYSKDLLRTGVIEARAGNIDTARRYLDRAIYMTGSYDVIEEAWYWMGEITVDPVEKRKALENCLAHDMRHTRARRALAILDGKLKEEDVVSEPPSSILRAAPKKRFGRCSALASTPPVSTLPEEGSTLL